MNNAHKYNLLYWKKSYSESWEKKNISENSKNLKNTVKKIKTSWKNRWWEKQCRLAEKDHICLKKVFSSWKIGLFQFLDFTIIYHHAQNQEKPISDYRGKL